MVETISLGYDYWDMRSPKTWCRAHFDHCKRDVPAVADAFRECQAAGMTEGQIIDMLVRIYRPARMFRGGWMKDYNLCIGIVGGRGSGKSCSAAALACLDYLLDGLPVWSNMDVRIIVRYHGLEKTYATIDLEKIDLLRLDTEYAGGLWLIDEVNVDISEARRAMSKRATVFSHVLQELRKKKMSLIYTVQSEEWVDTRLRWQTDFYVTCRDLFTMNHQGHPGERSWWKVYDMSGLILGESPQKQSEVSDFIVWEGSFWLKPWWEAYNSFELQGVDDSSLDKMPTDRLSATVVIGDSPHLAKLKAEMSLPAQISERVHSLGMPEIASTDVWKAFNITDRGEQTRIGTALREHYGWLSRESGGRKYYIIPQHAPGREEFPLENT